MDKLISIIVPCYNVENLIDRCVASLVQQTIGVEILEIILVDDCSQDGTWEHLQDWESKYPDSIMIIHCEENGRQGRARNIGIDYATAPYIGFVDSDDWVEPDMYEKLHDKLTQHDCDISMCQSWRDFDRPEQILESARDKNEDYLMIIDNTEKRKGLLSGGFMGFSVWNKLYKTALLKDNNIFFPEKLAYEDHFFSELLYFYVNKVYFLNERLYHYYVNPHSTVMESNANHHYDILTVDTALWDECERRGLVKDYREPMEYQFLQLCYLMSIKMLLLRLGKISYDFYLRLREETLKRVPNYRANRYVQELVTDLNKILLELLDREVSEDDLETLWNSLGDYIRRGVLSI